MEHNKLWLVTIYNSSDDSTLPHEYLQDETPEAGAPEWYEL